ncbi:MAG: phosphatase PAP2 family protein [Planctomycetota bacterium]
MGMTRYLITVLVVIFLSHSAYADSNDLSAFPSRLFSDANDTFTKPGNLAALLLAGGASVAMHNTDADRNVDDNLHRRAFDDTTDKIFDYAGNPWTHLGATGLWYLFSQANEDELNQKRAESLLSALLITDATIFTLKVIRNNDTPNGKDLAWPSGHTASSFCVASVLDEYYGPQVGVPAYIGACLVGWRMMDSGDHWASDVLFGGTLGYVVGHTVAGKHKQLEIAGFKIQPMIDFGANPVTGISLVKRF